MSEIISGSDGFIATDKRSDCTRQGYGVQVKGPRRNVLQNITLIHCKLYLLIKPIIPHCYIQMLQRPL